MGKFFDLEVDFFVLFLYFFVTKGNLADKVYLFDFRGINYFECSSLLLEVNFQEFSGKFDFFEGFLV